MTGQNTARSHVAVDWGTSSFRLWLIGDDGSVLAERRSDEGMTSAAGSGFAVVLDAHLAAIGAGADLPVIVCGMAGARQGWVEAGYLDTPAALSAIPEAAIAVPGTARDIRILPGLAQRDDQAPDVMRGEETQLLGAMADLGTAAWNVCMPGTHSKWVRAADGRVSGFSTFMTGELFDAISKHTILSHSVAEAGGGGSGAFAAAVVEAHADPALFTSRLFGLRAGQLLHGLSAADARARLSGLLIGMEIAGARAGSADGGIALVASGTLAALYQDAFAALGLDVSTIDADHAVRRGLAAAAKALWNR
ncbi:2-dehydro-3-deoxygalactonokinase [Rhizobium sp. TRM95111]|uniref:2-dehydro-3-deoxygalactonokinase n=1 Tax=Rhizobium alarense TaxID=2846851 RepID=UPI001F20C3D3|nr:2-dehydro-3-deoxygalactonokinase [Rhizobium alarense]MCF3642271.1 2-dehydro-3-deoxygalactonokinase [Rhizobium alarense]